MERFSKSGFRQLSHHLPPEISGFGVREVYNLYYVYQTFIILVRQTVPPPQNHYSGIV
jgi:hypothetical protein